MPSEAKRGPRHGAVGENRGLQALQLHGAQVLLKPGPGRGPKSGGRVVGGGEVDAAGGGGGKWGDRGKWGDGGWAGGEGGGEVDV